MADRVLDLNELRPGDVMQSRAKSLGGHATMVHRVWCQGSGYFGTSPWFPTLLDSEVDLSSADPESGMWLEDVAFYIDENTMPEFVGAYTQTAIDHIGAHNNGVESVLSLAEGEEQDTSSRAGVYSRTTEGAASTHNTDSKRLYGGRLRDSPWKLPHEPATAPTLEEEQEPERPAPTETPEEGWGLW